MIEQRCAKTIPSSNELLANRLAPCKPVDAYWLNFFNKPTPFIKGPDKSAKDKGCAVVFVFLKKLRRSYYHTEFFLATEDASTLQAGKLTKIYAEALTQRMKEQPENWLWSHRRWKWEWQPESGEIIK